MGLSSAIDWWDEWKLRILVLCSMSVQFFLFFAGYVRQLYALRRLRVMVWLAYIGGDALAVYALATLFNRQKQQQIPGAGRGGSSALEVLWAPVLLIHLGGQIPISAYSLEDNELWKRHAITLVSQVTVALYVFYKWWSGEKRLLQAAVLLFIVGILRFGQKPWALRRASYGSIASTYLYSPPPPRRAQEESSRWSRLGRCCTAVFACADLRDVISIWKGKPLGGVGAAKGINYWLEEYVAKAQEQVKHGPKGSSKAQRQKFNNLEAHVLKDIYKTFLDQSAPYFVRLDYLLSFLNLDGEDQHKVLRRWISLQFQAVYTMSRSAVTCLGVCTLLLLPSLPLASVALFAESGKDGYDKSDITVTYILYFGIVVIELAPFFITLLCQPLLRCILPASRPLLLWQDMVSQHNIMSFCARNMKPPALMKLATFSCLRDFINKHWYISHQCDARQISMLVRQHAQDGWKEYIRDAATYRRFNSLRGEHTLMKMSHHLLELDKLGWTFNLPFDEYVLLWHLITNLCIHHQTIDDEASTSQGQGMISSRRSSEMISNYMIYLLFVCPEMLIPGAESERFLSASYDIECMINELPLSSPDGTASGIAQWILGMEQDDQRLIKAPRISCAHRLAELLSGEEQRWELIQGVWVEMLCYSASRCRGYLHVKSLGVAGEFLTNVWLLLWCMGMQTLPDMMHNLGSPEEVKAAASV